MVAVLALKQISEDIDAARNLGSGIPDLEIEPDSDAARNLVFVRLSCVSLPGKDLEQPEART